MRQIPYPRRPVDRGPHVVGRVAELNLTGVQADPQPQRRQRRPLQRQSTTHRIRSTRESRHETVTLTLFDRAHPAVGSDALVHRTIQQRQRGRHLLWLGLPERRRTLDVSEQQRHRAGRQ